MPRGAQIMYPKDIAQVIQLGDIRTGMRVLESGAGSGAMSLNLLDAVGPDGQVTTIELRPEFARVAEANATLYYGARPQWWTLLVGDFDSRAAGLPEHWFDRIVLDMLDPWNRLDAAWRVLAPGGVLTAYVTTTTQISRLAEALRESGHWTEPQILRFEAIGVPVLAALGWSYWNATIPHRPASWHRPPARRAPAVHPAGDAAREDRTVQRARRF